MNNSAYSRRALMASGGAAWNVIAQPLMLAGLDQLPGQRTMDPVKDPTPTFETLATYEIERERPRDFRA